MKNRISLIVAADKDNGIGIENKLLCRLPDDLKYFKKITSNHTIVMGRKTYESIGSPLPDRNNIILSKNINYQVEGCTIINSIPELLNYISRTEEVFIIGGGSIYAQTIMYASKVYMTCIEHKFEADSYFPQINTDKDWKVTKVEKHDVDERHKYAFSFLTYERKNDSKQTDIAQHVINF
jgi:dihydrofolate reductase